MLNVAILLRFYIVETSVQAPNYQILMNGVSE